MKGESQPSKGVGKELSELPDKECRTMISKSLRWEDSVSRPVKFVQSDGGAVTGGNLERKAGPYVVYAREVQG